MISHDYNHVPRPRQRMDNSECERPRGSDVPEAKTIRKAQKGDAAAFESIYRRHCRRV